MNELREMIELLTMLTDDILDEKIDLNFCAELYLRKLKAIGFVKIENIDGQDYYVDSRNNGIFDEGRKVENR